MRFQRTPGIEAAPFQNELMLFNAATKKFCVLNATAAQLWQCLEEPKTAEQLAGELRARFRTNGARVEDDVTAVMSELEGLGLVSREAVA